MRARLFAFCSTFFILSFTFSPAQKNPSFIAVRGGASIPFAEYHLKKLDKGSFTTTGFNVSFEGSWLFKPPFGIGAAAGLNLHPVDVGMLGWEKVKSDPFLDDTYIQSDPYQVMTAMAGIYFQKSVWKKFSITGKLLGGLMWGKTPYQLNKSQYYGVGLIYEEITPANDYKFSWQAGTGIRYDISPCFGLALDAEFFYDKFRFDFDSQSGSYTINKMIAFINTTFGVRFNLDPKNYKTK
jgi:hypothetical protein